jgi:hypothetical protein
MLHGIFAIVKFNIPKPVHTITIGTNAHKMIEMLLIKRLSYFPLLLINLINNNIGKLLLNLYQ